MPNEVYFLIMQNHIYFWSSYSFLFPNEVKCYILKCIVAYLENKKRRKKREVDIPHYSVFSWSKSRLIIKRCQMCQCLNLQSLDSCWLHRLVPSLISSSSQLISLSEPEDEPLLSTLINSADCSHPAKLNSFCTGAAAGRTLNAKTSAKSTGCERECPTPKS